MLGGSVSVGESEAGLECRSLVLVLFIDAMKGSDLCDLYRRRLGACPSCRDRRSGAARLYLCASCRRDRCLWRRATGSGLVAVRDGLSIWIGSCVGPYYLDPGRGLCRVCLCDLSRPSPYPYGPQAGGDVCRSYSYCLVGQQMLFT